MDIEYILNASQFVLLQFIHRCYESTRICLKSNIYMSQNIIEHIYWYFEISADSTAVIFKIWWFISQKNVKVLFESELKKSELQTEIFIRLLEVM